MEKTFFQWIMYIIENYWFIFLKGAGTTLFIAVVSTAVGAALGILIGIVKTAPRGPGKLKNRFLRLLDIFVTVYVEFLRGTPMMVQAILFYFGFQEFLGAKFSPLFAALMIVSINTSAYLGEIVRGGIGSLDPGQAEAAKAIGMTYFQTLRHVVLPQVIKNVFPSFGNELIVNIKDTAVLNVISVTELFFETKTVKGAIFRTYEVFIISALIYLALTFTVSRILKLIEKRMYSFNSYDGEEAETA